MRASDSTIWVPSTLGMAPATRLVLPPCGTMAMRLSAHSRTTRPLHRRWRDALRQGAALEELAAIFAVGGGIGRHRKDSLFHQRSTISAARSSAEMTGAS